MPASPDDYVGSDDEDAMDAVLDESRLTAFSGSTVVGPSSAGTSKSEQVRNLKRKIRDLGEEREDINQQIQELRRLLQQKDATAKQCQKELKALLETPRHTDTTLNYDSEDFAWSVRMRETMKRVFNIDDYRLCQLAVCNANMDSRDIVCVMPTGGGKSLTYQLPAIQGMGCTLVISPLISLITDQIMHLRKNGIHAVKLTASTSKEEIKEITNSLMRLANNNGTAPGPERRISLCYVTPEKLAKSKSFQSLMQKLADSKRLDRIVVDEAHCVSQMGHDFRQDYRELRILKQLFPDVPIMALTATCPPKVRDDLIKILRLPKISDTGDVAGTVYFSSPLYRPNLHYKAFPKPSNAKKCIETMTNWILEHHPNDCGIIYCLTKKDTETVAKEVQTVSNGKIRTGYYHAGKGDPEKEHLHTQWHKGHIKVVCATIAFGMGIDKSDVRFVIHHSISKSLDGFYQESGRAGRDGKDSDCVMYYRPQDAWSLAAMSVKDNAEKLIPMLQFIQDTTECRKRQFANYFQHTAHLEITAWGDDARAACGHCDNCVRANGSSEERDVTFVAWQLLKLMTAVCGPNTMFTASKIVSLAKTGKYASTGKSKATEEVDLESICEGKVIFDREELEFLLVYLWTEGYVHLRYHQTAYSTLVYLEHSATAYRLTRMTLAQAKTGTSNRIRCVFPVHHKAKRKVKGKGKEAVVTLELDEDDVFDDDDDEEMAPPTSKKAPTRPKGKGNEVATPVEDEEVLVIPRKKTTKRKSDSVPLEIGIEDDDESSGSEEWSFNLRGGGESGSRRPKRQRTGPDVIEIDSD